MSWVVIVCEKCSKLKRFNEWIKVSERELELLKRGSCIYKLCPECSLREEAEPTSPLSEVSY